MRKMRRKRSTVVQFRPINECPQNVAEVFRREGEKERMR